MEHKKHLTVLIQSLKKRKKKEERLSFIFNLRKSHSGTRDMRFHTTVSYFVVCGIHACVLLACCGRERPKPEVLPNYTLAYHLPVGAYNCATGMCLFCRLPYITQSVQLMKRRLISTQ